jgi:hypothetical protein
MSVPNAKASLYRHAPLANSGESFLLITHRFFIGANRGNQDFLNLRLLRLIIPTRVPLTFSQEATAEAEVVSKSISVLSVCSC